jgi:hypothetical protein
MSKGRPVRRDCACGSAHLVSTSVARDITLHGPTQPVMTPRGAWYVPRVYAAIHGITGPELAEAAARYGFNPIPI